MKMYEYHPEFTREQVMTVMTECYNQSRCSEGHCPTSQAEEHKAKHLQTFERIVETALRTEMLSYLLTASVCEVCDAEVKKLGPQFLIKTFKTPMPISLQVWVCGRCMNADKPFLFLVADMPS